MSEVAKIILAQRSNLSLLNWDGETSVDDLLENIKLRVRKATGWDKLNVSMGGGVLTIRAIDRGVVETLLVYNNQTGREVYGRLKQCGITASNIEELKGFKF